MSEYVPDYITDEQKRKYPKLDAQGQPIPGSFSFNRWMQDPKRNCGCGGRAVKVVRWLGVDMDESYVRANHARATLKALKIAAARVFTKARELA